MDRILTALRQYEQEPREKRAVLLTPTGGYYLFDQRFCGISEYELSLAGKELYVQGSSAPCGVFLGVVGNTLQWAATDTDDFQPDRLSLIFHIALDKECARRDLHKLTTLYLHGNKLSQLKREWRQEND